MNHTPRRESGLFSALWRAACVGLCASVGLAGATPAGASPPPPPTRTAPPTPRPPPPQAQPPVVYVPAPARVVVVPAEPPPPLPTAMRVIYAPFYATGLVLRYGVYYLIVAPLDVLGRTLSYGVEGGVERDRDGDQ